MTIATRLEIVKIVAPFAHDFEDLLNKSLRLGYWVDPHYTSLYPDEIKFIGEEDLPQ